MSMTSMNETEGKAESNTLNEFYRKTSSKAPLGVVEKVDGAVKYVVPNSIYMGLST
jgi:hypothetical protein